MSRLGAIAFAAVACFTTAHVAQAANLARPVVWTITDDEGKILTFARIQAQYVSTPGTYVPARPKDRVQDGISIVLVTASNVKENLFIAFSNLQMFRVEQREFVLDVTYFFRKRDGSTLILIQNITEQDRIQGREGTTTLTELNAQGKATKSVPLKEFDFVAGYGGNPGYEFKWDLVNIIGYERSQTGGEKRVEVPFYHISKMVRGAAEELTK